MTDHDLHRHFTAWRKVNRALTPSFDEVVNLALSDRKLSLNSAAPTRRSRTLAVALASLTLSLLAAWLFTHPVVPTTAREISPSNAIELAHLNEVCDAILQRIEGEGGDPAGGDPAVASFDPDREMTWSTTTDSLISFRSLHFQPGTLP